MKKIIVATALALALTGAAFASNPTPAAATACPQAACPATQACRQDAPRFNPFDGIQLTNDQQTAINNLNEQQRQNRENARSERRQERRDRSEAARTQRDQCRRDYLTSLKGILTPEQYVTFLENCFVNVQPGRPEGNRPERQGRAARDGRRVRQNAQPAQATQVAQPAQAAQPAN